MDKSGRFNNSPNCYRKTSQPSLSSVVQEGTPHVAQKTDSAIDGRTTRHAGYAVSLRIRKRVEEVFGWAKTVGVLRKTRLIGLAKVKAQTLFTLAAYNLTRMATIFGWRLNTG